MKHSLIIIYDFKVKNQIRTARNLHQGVLQVLRNFKNFGQPLLGKK